MNTRDVIDSLIITAADDWCLDRFETLSREYYVSPPIQLVKDETYRIEIYPDNVVFVWHLAAESRRLVEPEAGPWKPRFRRVDRKRG